MTDPAADVPDHLTIRPPRQERSRQAWDRVLDAGVALLEEAGYEGFTIAAVCKRAHVPPRAIYDRAPTKDALFLAVYEHGMARIKADHGIFTDPARWLGLDAAALIEAVVREVTAVFSRHQALLRAVILISGVHPEVYRRGSLYSRELGELLTALLRPVVAPVTPARTDADTMLRTCYTTMFSALVIRVAYGAGFAADPVDDATFTAQLTRMISLYLRTAS
jgi:AcrR family transcriptional regulator